MKCIFLLASYKAWTDQEGLPPAAYVIFFLEWFFLFFLSSNISGSDAIVHREEEKWPLTSENRVMISQSMKMSVKGCLNKDTK